MDGEYVGLQTLGSSVHELTGTAEPGTATFTSMPTGNYWIYNTSPGPTFEDTVWDFLGSCGTDPLVSVLDVPFCNQAKLETTVPAGGSIDCTIYWVPPA